jgi:hypothetical protein
MTASPTIFPVLATWASDVPVKAAIIKQTMIVFENAQLKQCAKKFN